MRTLLTPGVYFEKPRPREIPQQQRTDVTGFVGLAERGPLHAPRRLTAWRQFQQVFGGFLPYANLAYAVHAFFENGGRTCWVVRVADAENARAAAADVPDENDAFAFHIAAGNPGTWGNQLSILLQSAGIASAQHVVLTPAPPPDLLAISAIAGFETGSWVRLTQPDGDGFVQTTRRVASVDPIRGMLKFDTALPVTGDGGFRLDDDSAPISLETLEFTLLILEADQVVERFGNLAPDPAHGRYAVSEVNAQSALVKITPGETPLLPELPWRGALEGGLNGLRTLTLQDVIGASRSENQGLATLAKEDEIGLLAMPDLVLKPAAPPPTRRAPKRTIDPCALDTPTARITAFGRVLDAENDLPLPEVRIDISDGINSIAAESIANGVFSVADLLPGSIDVLFRLENYEEKTLRLASEGDLGDVRLTPLDLPPAFKDFDIYAGQAAMVAQCESLRDRFALIDPPLGAQGGQLDLSALQAWRAHFDTAFAALYYPWLRIDDPRRPDAPRGRLLPPSGHIAGITAKTDLAEGVFRSAANRALNWVDDLGAAIDDAAQSVLNPLGINVLRAFPGRGIRLFGDRTMSSNSALRFVTVRRLLNMLEEAMHDGLQWAVFEPNDATLRLALRSVLVNMLSALWRRGAFAGETAEAAFQVRCDEVTTPEEVQALGRVIAEVSVAPTVPYEFIVLRLGLTADELRISEV